jgi:translation initiation factor eIF-2B subunit delta
VPTDPGKILLQRLVAVGLSCTYIQLNALSYIMKDVRSILLAIRTACSRASRNNISAWCIEQRVAQVAKVFIGAAAMMNNGTVLGRAGTAMVAMVAQAYHIPVMVCCETYKFCDRAQLDSICYNGERKKDLTWRINWPT